jgi:hypothetical protein
MEKESIKELILTTNLDWSQPYNEQSWSPTMFKTKYRFLLNPQYFIFKKFKVWAYNILWAWKSFNLYNFQNLCKFIFHSWKWDPIFSLKWKLNLFAHLQIPFAFLVAFEIVSWVQMSICPTIMVNNKINYTIANNFLYYIINKWLPWEKAFSSNKLHIQ